MALQNNPHLYSGGNVRLDSSPYTNFAIQLMAKKKAEDDALDQYYSKLPSTINGAGMRDVDRQVFAQGMDGVMNFWKQNRDAIKNPRKDGGAAQFNYEKLVREQKEIVDRSKMAGKTDLELGKTRFNKDFNHIFDDPINQEKIARSQLPVNHPEYQAIDMYELATPPAPLTAKHIADFNKLLTDGLEPSEKLVGTKKLGNLQMENLYEKTYSPESLAEIGKKAALVFRSDKQYRHPFMQQYKEIISNPELLQQYSETFQKVYGKVPETPEEIFAAQTMSQFGQVIRESKVVDDVAGKMALGDQYARGLISLRDKYAKARIDYKAKTDAKEQAGVLNQFIDDQFNAGVVEEKIPGGKVRTTQVVSHNGKKYEGTEVDMPKSVAGQFAHQDPTTKEWTFPDRFVITNDKKHVIPIFSKDGARNKPITMQQYRLLLGKDLLTKSELGGEVNDTEDETELEGIANDF